MESEDFWSEFIKRYEKLSKSEKATLIAKLHGDCRIHPQTFKIWLQRKRIPRIVSQMAVKQMMQKYDFWPQEVEKI